jgi:hypothetical protein
MAPEPGARGYFFNLTVLNDFKVIVCRHDSPYDTGGFIILVRPADGVFRLADVQTLFRAGDQCRVWRFCAKPISRRIGKDTSLLLYHKATKQMNGGALERWSVGTGER